MHTIHKHFTNKELIGIYRKSYSDISDIDTSNKLTKSKLVHDLS